jgi:uncharacterized phage protein gp47/JayE
MPSFERPSLPEIIRRDTSDFEYEQGTQAARLPGTIEHAYVRAHAGVAHGLHGRIDRVRQDAFWATSSDEALIAKAALFGIFHIPATRSTGVIVVTADPNTNIPIGTIFEREDGATYRTTQSAVNPDDNFVLCPATAVASGAEGNMAPGTKVVLQVPMAGVEDEAVADEGGWQNGEAAEDTVSLRRRLQKRLSDPPKGGGPGDYVRWALGDADEEKVPAGKTPPGGVTRAWEYGKVPKIGRVTVLIMTDGEDDPFPTDAKRTEVWEWIKLFAPIALPFPQDPGDPAEQSVLSPIPHPVDVTIELIVEDGFDLVEVETAVVAALEDMIDVRSTPPMDDAQVFYKSWLAQAISNTAGVKDAKITAPVGDIALAQWELVTLGVVNFT